MDNFFLTEGLPGDETVTIVPPATPYSFVKVVATYQRTLQVKQFEPLSPSASVEVEIHDPTQVSQALKAAMDATRDAVKSVFALAVPAVMSQMDKEFVNDFIDLASPETRALMLARLEERGKTHDIPRKTL